MISFDHKSRVGPSPGDGHGHNNRVFLGAEEHLKHPSIPGSSCPFLFASTSLHCHGPRPPHDSRLCPSRSDASHPVEQKDPGGSGRDASLPRHRPVFHAQDHAQEAEAPASPPFPPRGPAWTKPTYDVGSRCETRAPGSPYPPAWIRRLSDPCTTHSSRVAHPDRHHESSETNQE